MKLNELKYTEGSRPTAKRICRGIGSGLGKNGGSGHKGQKSRWYGVRPTVRGSVMNPNDHPHGGGEGKCPVGRDAPRTPWGKRALGVKTRNTKKASNKLIVRRRNGKAL